MNIFIPTAHSYVDVPSSIMDESYRLKVKAFSKWISKPAAQVKRAAIIKNKIMAGAAA